MKTRLAVIALLALALSACGPIIGQVMRTTDGIKNFQVIEGALSDLKPGSRLLVFGPFARTAEAFYISRGEDAYTFADSFNEAGLFQTETYLERDYARLDQRAAALRDKTPAQLAADLELKAPPQLILFGTLVERETIIAPTRGVVMTTAYRLEFFNPSTGNSTVLEVTVKDLFEDCIPSVVRAIMNQQGRA